MQEATNGEDFFSLYYFIVSVLSFPVLDGIVVTVLMQVTPSNTPAETLQILIECIPNRKIIQVHVLAPWWSIQTTTTCWCHLVATTTSSPLVGDIPH